MLKTNELRLGNWVYAGHGDFPMYVIAIYGDTAYLEFEGNEGDMWEEKDKDLKPIPLTEEILLKCGLKKSLNKCCYGMITSNGHRISYFLDKGSLMLETNRIHIDVQSLHQLQNLYFALTGKELEIKL